MAWGKSHIAVIALIVSVLSLGFSWYTFTVGEQHFSEVTQPKIRHDVVRDFLVRLDHRIDEAEGYILVAQQLGEDTRGSQENLTSAIGRFNLAERAWVNGNYDEAESLIRQANFDIDNIPVKLLLGDSLLSLWLYAVLAGILVVAVVMFNLYRRRRQRL